jgi:FkbM family methyltransferase
MDTKNRLVRWLNRPISHKLNSLARRTERLMVWVLSETLSVFIRPLVNTQFGRRLLYTAYPPNMFLVALTPRDVYVVNTSDTTIGLDTFVEREAYDSPKLRSVIALLPPTHTKQTLVDIGANIGTISVNAVANGLFERAIAFEPEPNNFRLLKANVALNNLDGRFVLHNAALSDNSEGTLEFELSADNHGDHRVRVAGDAGHFSEEKREVISVKSDILDNHSDEFDRNSTLIWIDTQGYEGLVFSGARAVIANRIPICMEFWPYALERAGGIERLVGVFRGSPYQTVIDLRNPGRQLPMSSETLRDIANGIGFDGEFTDLLVL